MTTVTLECFDAAPLSGTRITKDGYLATEARIARTGIQIYAGHEVGVMADQVRVYRPESEVFHTDALASMAHRPVTIEHPKEAVTADNWKKYAVGSTGDEVKRDGQFVRVPLVMMDKAAIEAVQSGKRELSVGYTCDLRFEAGTTPEGEAYDAIQTNIRGNHLAAVTAGRAGAACRIGDAGKQAVNKPKEDQMTDKALKTITVDGIPVEVTDQAVAVITKLQQANADAVKAAADAKAGYEAELAKKDAAIDDLKAKVLSDADLDKRVNDRADLVGKAKAIAPDVKTAGLSDAAIRKAVVAAKLGEDAVKDRSDAYIDARFEIIAEDAAKTRDPIRDAAGAGSKAGTDAYAQYCADLANAYKGA